MQGTCKRGKMKKKRPSSNGVKGHSKTQGRDKNTHLCQSTGK